MASLLGDMDNISAKPAPVKSRKRKPEPEPDYDDGGSSPNLFSSTYRSKAKPTGYADADNSSDGPYDDGVGASSGDDYFLSPKKKPRTEAPGITPAIERMGKLGVESGPEDADSSFDDIDMDAFMEIDEDELEDLKPKPRAKIEVDAEAKPLKPLNTNAGGKKKLDDTPSWLSIYDSLKVTTDDSLGSGPTTPARTAAPTNLSVLEENGSLRFYWLDYLEHDGKLYFIGKTQDKKTKTWVSISVTVENLQRNLFVLPRERRMEEDEDTGEMYETDQVPELPEIYSDFDRLRRKAGIKAFKGKFVKRKYAFGEKDVPREEKQWLKVVYGFNGKWLSQAA